MEVLEHVKNIDKVLIEIERVMKPNGHTIITFPSNNFPVTYDPINFIMKKDYIDVVYSEIDKPFTSYPKKLTNYLSKKYN